MKFIILLALTLGFVAQAEISNIESIQADTVLAHLENMPKKTEVLLANGDLKYRKIYTTTATGFKIDTWDPKANLMLSEVFNYTYDKTKKYLTAYEYKHIDKHNETRIYNTYSEQGYLVSSETGANLKYTFDYTLDQNKMPVKWSVKNGTTVLEQNEIKNQVLTSTLFDNTGKANGTRSITFFKLLPLTVFEKLAVAKPGTEIKENCVLKSNNELNCAGTRKLQGWEITTQYTKKLCQFKTTSKWLTATSKIEGHQIDNTVDKMLSTYTHEYKNCVASRIVSKYSGTGIYGAGATEESTLFIY